MKKSAAQLCCKGSGVREFVLRSGRHWGRHRDQLCQLSEVLDCGSEEEFVLSTKRTSQPEPVEAQDALEMDDYEPAYQVATYSETR